MSRLDRLPNLLSETRVYLSGPMDFVASRADERQNGWRNRIGEFLREFGCIVFDPWVKPEVRGLLGYGREGDDTARLRETWSFEMCAEGKRARSRCVRTFWETLHIDLRMVDTSDFVIAYTPTNVYSVGTPHEIVVARQQFKPVLLVSPPIEFDALDDLRAHLADDETGTMLLDRLAAEVPIRPNPPGIPSLWYMPLIEGDNFFDGFGFAPYRERFGWQETTLDRREAEHPPVRPLLPFLEKLNDDLPTRWNADLEQDEPDDDWILWELGRRPPAGAAVESVVQHPHRNLGG